MTKYDIKLRRKSLTQGQIERHKDFKGLYDLNANRSKSALWIRMIAIVLTVCAVVAMVYFGFVRITEQKEVNRSNPDQELFDEFKSE